MDPRCGYFGKNSSSHLANKRKLLTIFFYRCTFKLNSLFLLISFNGNGNLLSERKSSSKAKHRSHVEVETLFKLVSSSLETKFKANSQEFAVAYLCCKQDEVWRSTLRFLQSLVARLVIRFSSTQCTSSHGRELFEMKQITICHEYGLKI